jgi:hypothetical protein
VIDFHLLDLYESATVEAKALVSVVDTSADLATIAAGLVFALAFDLASKDGGIFFKMLCELFYKVKVKQIHSAVFSVLCCHLEKYNTQIKRRSQEVFYRNGISRFGGKEGEMDCFCKKVIDIMLLIRRNKKTFAISRL